jgi:hypothetical protein
MCVLRTHKEPEHLYRQSVDGQHESTFEKVTRGMFEDITVLPMIWSDTTATSS